MSSGCITPFWRSNCRETLCKWEIWRNIVLLQLWICNNESFDVAETLIGHPEPYQRAPWWGNCRSHGRTPRAKCRPTVWTVKVNAAAEKAPIPVLLFVLPFVLLCFCNNEIDRGAIDDKSSLVIGVNGRQQNCNFSVCFWSFMKKLFTLFYYNEELCKL